MVSVIVINYNTFQMTSDCIRSIYQYTKATPFGIVLVDNASTERDPKDFLQEFPQLQLIESKTNSGFAGGNNLGITASRGEFVLLLNSDTLLTEDSISKTVSYLKNHPTIGVVGCRQIFPDGQVQYSARKFRTISWELLDLFRFIIYAMSYQRRSQLMLGQFFQHNESVEADWVNGAYFLLPRVVIQQLPGGKLDERFFMYGEDVLWCEQIKNLGYKIFFLADTTIIHISSGSTDLSKQLRLRKVMVKHELAIMAERKGKGLYYACFNVIYQAKEWLRYSIKWVVFKLSGRLIR
jgi:GT2 family glycosyltransferase